MKPVAALWRLAVTVAVAIVLLVLIANVIRQPAATATRSYSAEFTDASGLHVDADVRVRGVRVGKVESVALQRRDGQSIAAVGFNLDKRYGIVAATRLAIKYQALTGLRYVDVVDPSENYSAADLVARVPTAMTQPSFDITTLFNGLQPVIATLSPADVNTFTANAVSFLSGDGQGLAPMLESMRTLTRFVSDRQHVVATLMRNLSDVAGTLGGHSKDVIQLMKWLSRPLDAALTVLDELRKSLLYGNAFADPVVRLMTNAGFKPGIDVDSALDRAFTNLDDAIDAFKLVPVMWENIVPPADAGVPEPCSRGPAQLPAAMDVLLNGRRVVLCNR